MKDNWNYVTNGVLPSIDDESQTNLIEIHWVNLEHKKPFQGIDLVEWNISFNDYEKDYGRTIVRWRNQITEKILLPEEVVDKDTLFEYIRAATGFYNN